MARIFGILQGGSEERRPIAVNDEIMKKMWELEQENARVKFKDGNVLTGFVDVFSTRYDNDGEATICFASDDGQMLIISESEVADIEKVAP